MSAIPKALLAQLLGELNAELAARDERGELYLVGGAVMCLVFDARASTRDVDAYFRPVAAVREAAARVAARHDLPVGWLNDAVRGYLSDRGEFTEFAVHSHLAVFTPVPAYLFAMKAMAMRLGAEFQDEGDVRFLIRLLELTRVDDAMALIARYYPRERIPAKTSLALEELLGG